MFFMIVLKLNLSYATRKKVIIHLYIDNTLLPEPGIFIGMCPFILNSPTRTLPKHKLNSQTKNKITTTRSRQRRSDPRTVILVPLAPQDFAAINPRAGRRSRTDFHLLLAGTGRVLSLCRCVPWRGAGVIPQTGCKAATGTVAEERCRSSGAQPGS